MENLLTARPFALCLIEGLEMGGRGLEMAHGTQACQGLGVLKCLEVVTDLLKSFSFFQNATRLCVVNI